MRPKKQKKTHRVRILKSTNFLDFLLNERGRWKIQRPLLYFYRSRLHQDSILYLNFGPIFTEFIHRSKMYWVMFVRIDIIHGIESHQ